MLQKHIDNNFNSIISTKDYIKYLHSNSNDSYVVVANKIDGLWNQKEFLYSADQICNDMLKNDCYITLNNFRIGRRTLNAINEYTSFYIDIDCYKLLGNLKLEFNKSNIEYLKDKVLFEIREDLIGTAIPNPSFVVDSGRGLYLIWKINNVCKDYAKRWGAIQNALLGALKSLGADSQSVDGARVLRVPGSINTKACGGSVEVLEFNDYIYDIEEFEEFFEEELKVKLDDEKEKVESKVIKFDKNKKLKKKYNTIKKNRTSFIFNDRSLYKARIEDIEKLCEMRDYKISKYNCRELTLFLYRYWITQFTGNPQEAFKRTLELNSKFDVPFTEDRVRVDTESVYRAFKEGKKYKYSNSKLIHMFKITEAEQWELSTIISAKLRDERNNEKDKERKKESRRNINGLTLKEQRKQELVNKIHILKGKGLKQIQIAEELAISKGTVSKYLKLPYIELIIEIVKQKSFLKRLTRIGEGVSLSSEFDNSLLVSGGSGTIIDSLKDCNVESSILPIQINRSD